MDCDGTLTVDDCDDSNLIYEQSNDNDCDGVLTTNDCDDSDAVKPNNDMDCDGALNNR